MPISTKYQFTKWLKRLNRVVQVVLFLSLIYLVNQWGINHFIRKDLTSNNLYSLSPETQAYLDQLDSPVEVIVTIPSSSPIEEERILYTHASQLLREYENYSRQNGSRLLTIKHIDIYRDLGEAERLASEVGLDQVNTIIFKTENRVRLIRPDEILRFNEGKPGDFNGEAAFTSALIEVSSNEAPVVYFLTGHGEMHPDSNAASRGLSKLTTELRLRNYRIDTIDLSETKNIPKDADLLVIADPQGPFLSVEAEIIRSYLSEEAGRLLAWISPTRKHGLNNLLLEWGLTTDNRVILESNRNYVESSGSYLIRNFAPHPITQRLIDHQTFLLSGSLRPIILLDPTSLDERLITQPILASSSQSWAEQNWDALEDPEFNEGLDLAGPIAVGATAERRASSQLGIEVEGGKMVIFGSGDLFSNERLSSLGNNHLIFNTLNWILDRNNLISIPPRELREYTLVASSEQFRLIILVFLAVPLVIGLLGISIYWVRKI